jgi:hypothetical protein
LLGLAAELWLLSCKKGHISEVPSIAMRSITSGISFAPKSSDHIRTHAASISSTFQPLYVSSIFPPLLMPLRSAILADLNFSRCAICAARPAAVGTRVRLYLNSPKTAFALPTVSWFLLCLFSSHSHTPRCRWSFSSLGAFHQTSASFQRLRTAEERLAGLHTFVSRKGVMGLPRVPDAG